MFCSVFVLFHPVQSIGCNKICILTPQAFCLFIHQCGKPFHAAPYIFRDHDRCIIVGFQHQGIQQVTQAVFLPGPDPQMDLGLGGGRGGYGYTVLQISHLQGQDTCHYLCGAGHGANDVLALSIQDTAAATVHENSGLGIEFQKISRLIPVFRTLPGSLTASPLLLCDICSLHGLNTAADKGNQ